MTQKVTNTLHPYRALTFLLDDKRFAYDAFSVVFGVSVRNSLCFSILFLALIFFLYV